MEKLADNGDGDYAYIDDMDQPRRLFLDDLTSTLQVIALNANLHIRADRLAVQISNDPDVAEFAQLVNRATELGGR